MGGRTVRRPPMLRSPRPGWIDVVRLPYRYLCRAVAHHPRDERDDGGHRLAALAAFRSYTHSAQITKTFNAMINRDHTG